MGANPAYSSRVPVWGLVVFPPLAVDLQLTPGYQQSLQVNATASAKTHSAAGECQGGEKAPCAGETQMSTASRLSMC